LEVSIVISRYSHEESNFTIFEIIVHLDILLLREIAESVYSFLNNLMQIEICVV